MLTLAGAPAQKHMQGRVFLGEKTKPAPVYLFFHRDRMDEAYELMRAARGQRFKYIRNYEPERTYAQNLDYMNRMPTLVDLRRLHAEGKLDPIQSLWFRERKPIEELYDVIADPHETVNLAGKPEHAKTLEKMRKATKQWQENVGDLDLGLVPEPIMMEKLRTRRAYR